MTLVSQAEFSRLKKVSRKSVTDWKFAGRLVMVGDLVDVERTQEKLLRSSGHRAKGRLTLLPEAADIADTILIVTEPEARPGGHPDAPCAVILASVMATSAGIDAAEAVLRHISDERIARDVADWVTEKAIAGAVEMVEDDYARPAGYSTWRDHPLFADPAAHQQPHEWGEMVADAAAWRAEHGV